MKTIHFEQVYVKAYGTAAGKLESEGPMKDLLDVSFTDHYCGESSFERAERVLIRSAMDQCLRKANMEMNEVDVVIGADLNNQLAASHYTVKDIPVSFVGMYAACASSSLVIGQGAMMIEAGYVNHALAFTSSHNATAERQFRFPNEYGVQKKETTTTTATGAGCVLLTSTPTDIQVKSVTIGTVKDWHFLDVNDMGKAMVPAAYQTIQTVFQETNTDFADYDGIYTGDLSALGFSFLCELFLQDGYDLRNHLNDCGLMIYDRMKQDVFCGGSGCACSMLYTFTKLMQLLKTKQAKRIMVVATGALHSPTAVKQKESIPCIAHAIVYERVGD